MNQHTSAEAACLEVRGLRVSFGNGTVWSSVVDNVSLRVERGRSLVLLGESGSGKSVTLRSIVALTKDEGARLEGQIRVEGSDVLQAEAGELLALRGRRVGFVFQEPLTAFDPVFRVGDQIAETIVRHRGTSWREALAESEQLFDLVQIPSAKVRLGAYPHELSGGLRQRAMIAMAICCKPALLLADEPTTALDATVQIQILLLLRQIQKERDTAIVFVTHDLGVAAEMADEIAVMYQGRIVEQGPATRVLGYPEHTYTRGLIGCVARGSYRDGSLGDAERVRP